jgi:hypothetical protein
MANVLNDVVGLTFAGRIALARLPKRLVTTRLARRTYQNASAANGTSLSIPYVDVQGAAATRAIGAAATASDVHASTRVMTFQQVYYGIDIDSLEQLFASPDLLAETAEQLADGVAEKIDAMVNAQAVTEIPWETGTLDGTSAFTTAKLANISEARRLLFNNNCPTDGGDLALVTNSKEAKALRDLSELQSYSMAGSDSTLRAGSIGQVFGFQVFESNNIQDATTSTAGEASLPGAVVGVHAIGATTLSLNGLGTGTLKAGTSFTIAGIAGRYVVAANATITSNAATPTIYPGLKAATSGSEAVTFIEHTAAQGQNIAFHRDALLVLSRNPAPIGGGIVEATVSDPQTGLALRMSSKGTLLGDAGAAFRSQLVCDAVVAARWIRPDFAVRITGSVA